MILKPGKSAELTESYRRISLLPVLSKLFEKLFVSRIFIIIESCGLIADHQFGFQSKYATTEQIHRILKRIKNRWNIWKQANIVLIFLDVSQAFDKVWHRGLLYQIKNRLSNDLYVIIKAYLLHLNYYILAYKTFRVKYGEVLTQLKEINSGMPQGSILGALSAIYC